MIQCFVHDESLRFSRTVYGVMAMIAFLTHNYWLILLTSILMFIGVPSENYNLFYQFHSRFLRQLSKKKKDPVARDQGEISFACSFGGILLLISFFLLYFGQAEGLAWVLVLTTSMFMFLAGLAGVCTASLLYAFFKKSFKNGKKR